MPLFDDPVEAEVGGQRVLWLGTESVTSDGRPRPAAIIVSESGNVSAVQLESVKANFRLVNGGWLNVNDEGAAEAARPVEQQADPTQFHPSSVSSNKVYPPGTIFDTFGNAYTSDGDPIE
jgi:hypothetical protein